MGTFGLQAAFECRGNPAEEEGSGRGSLKGMISSPEYMFSMFTYHFAVLRAILTGAIFM